VKKLERYQAIAAGDQWHAPVGKALGLRLVAARDDWVRFELSVRPDYLNSEGALQGGIISVMADAAMGLAYGTLLEETQGMATIEYKINFARPVTAGQLVAEAKTVRRGKTTGIMEAEVWDDHDRLVAKAQGTMITLP
jgi:uncharacterized protein (TIGR00369 family)